MTLRQRVVMLGLAAAAVYAAACANASAPPGGPPDDLPPGVVSITPSTGATNIQPRQVQVQFDEVIAEIPRGAQDLGGIVFISPKSGVPRVSWERTRIDIRPRDGFLPNRVYTVEIRPGIMDLRSNVIDTAIRIVFSTGGEIPETSISGVVFDWVAGRPAPQALVEAIAQDSTTYQTMSDSTGRFMLRNVPAGGYVMRAVIDRNTNRELEPLEPWDTASVVITADARAELYAFQHDTLPMRVQTVVYNDSLNELRLTFDKPFIPGFSLDPAQFQLRGPDSSFVQITRVVTGPDRVREDSVRRAEVADSVRRAQLDTTAAGRARADSIERRRVADSVAAATRAAEQRRLDELRRGGRPAPRVDTLPTPRMNRPRPFAEIILVLATPLQQGATYSLLATGLRSISGVSKPTPARTFVVPRRAPRDTTGRSGR